jgi:molybdate transport system permease protein
VKSPVVISLSVGLAATVLSLPLAVATAFYLARSSRGIGRSVVQTAVMLPLVLPPVVVGFLLLRLFSPRGGLGRVLETVGAPVAFHWLGAVVAAAVVGFPLFVISIIIALHAVDPRLETVSRTLGRSPLATFFRVTLPLAWPGILAGATISFARGLGEFGATIVLAGRIPGETETIPLAIYAELDAPGGEARVLSLVVASIAIGVAAVVASRALDGWHRRRLLEVER